MQEWDKRLFFVFVLFSMANRRLSRSIVLQTLFEWDALPNKEEFSSFEKMRGVLARNIEEFAPGSTDISYMENLLRGVLEKRRELDDVISKAAPDWPIERIAPVDRNILRLGLFELIFADRKEVPAKVAINEAIELGKRFGGHTTGRFVNGVLGAVYNELGEPGKEEIGKKNLKNKPKNKKSDKNKKEVSFENLPIEKKGGAVVFAREGGEVFIALVHDVFGRWTLPKGSIEKNESIQDAIVRNIKEEIGLPVSVHDHLGDNEYIAKVPGEGKVRRQVSFYLVESPFQDIVLEEKGGLDDARWFKLADILDLNFYEDILPIITKAINLLLAKEISTVR